MTKKIWIVIPTYNEAGSVLTTIDRVHDTVPDAQVLIVDDNSPDGTGTTIQKGQTTRPFVHLLHREKKEGLGPAYAAGLRTALDSGAEIILHCDADGSHPAAVLPLLIAQLDQADVAVASRYVRGGSMKIDPFRHLVSGIGNWYIKLLLGRQLQDWSSGCKAWRRETLGRVLARPLRSTGYACLMEMSARAVANGAKIVEVPMVFQPRYAGQSKFSWAIVVEDIRRAWELRRGLAKGQKM